MSVLKFFPAQVAAVLVIAAACGAYPLSAYASGEVIMAAAAGAALSALNVMLGYAAVEYAFDKSYTVFLKTVLGGMGVRLLLMLGAMLALLLTARVHALAFTISMLGFYAAFLALEIGYIQKKIKTKNQR